MRRWWQLPEGWLSLFLLMAMVLTAARSIQQAGWPASLQAALGILTPAAVVGLLVGLLFACIRRIPRSLAHVVGVLSGTAWVVQLSGALRHVEVAEYRNAVSYLDPLLQGWKDLAVELSIRTLILWRTFMRGDTGEDSAIFIVILAFACWMAGFLAAWFAFRSRWPWAAVGLIALVILLNTFYAPNVPGGYFGFFAFLSIIFLVYYLWRQREQTWRRENVRYPRELAQGILWIAITFSAILVLSTSLLPTTATGAEESNFLDQLLQPWREVRSTWERLFTNVSGSSSGEGRLGAYGSSFSLGGARIAPNGVALEVRSSRNGYLRGITFDQYNGRGWINTTEQGPLWTLAGISNLPGSRKGRTTVSQIITPRLQGGNMVFALAEPISTTLPAVAQLSDRFEELGFLNIVTVRSRSPLGEGQPYRVISFYSVADKTSLRQAGQQYHPQIRDRYLQLPATLPQRVRGLADQIVAQELDLEALLQSPPGGVEVTVNGRAISSYTEGTNPPTTNLDLREITLQVNNALVRGEQITLQFDEGEIVGVSPSGSLVRAGLVSPYDAAEAIQSYLRTQFEYDESISEPPPEMDRVDYFLFESKEGYCDYFASAMAVLLRTQGIPARTARGYASGTYDNEVGAYIVPVASAHTWTEVYFPEYGWQRFEPTAASYTSVPLRPEEPPQESSGGSSSTSRPGESPGNSREDLLAEADFDPGAAGAAGVPVMGRGSLVPLLIVGGLLLAAATALAIVNLRVGRGLGGLTSVAATYERMCRWAGLSRLSPSGQPTPLETAHHLGTALPTQQSGIDRIAGSYVRERYSRHRLLPKEVTDVRQAWKDIRWPLWGRLFYRLRPEEEADRWPPWQQLLQRLRLVGEEKPSEEVEP